MIKFIEGTALSKMCDYSFGDQASVICQIPGGYIKPANSSNLEFIEKVESIRKTRNYMTLFIDNIRLYKREIRVSNPNDQIWINDLTENNDLLSLCSMFPGMRFVIFCNLEDTSICEKISGKIPENVIKIYSANSIYHNNIIEPFPYGIQRKLSQNDSREDILRKRMDDDLNISPLKLVYINHNILNNRDEREGINEIFDSFDWATVNRTRIDYDTFLSNISNHKFMICPIGNAIDCHRNWEVLYMRRVPIMKKNKYLEKLFSPYPVLFVDNYSDVTKDLLERSEMLYQTALSLDFSKLDLENIFNQIIEDLI